MRLIAATSLVFLLLFCLESRANESEDAGAASIGAEKVDGNGEVSTADLSTSDSVAIVDSDAPPPDEVPQVDIGDDLVTLMRRQLNESSPEYDLALAYATAQECVVRHDRPECAIRVAMGHFYGDAPDVIAHNVSESYRLFTELLTRPLNDEANPQALTKAFHTIVNRYLALHHALGLGVRRDQARALLHSMSSARGGNLLSRMFLGFRFYLGLGLPMGCENAVHYYRDVADAVVPQLMRSGDPLIERVRLSSEADKAAQANSMSEDDIVEYYRHAASRDDRDAQNLLGELHLRGRHGLRQDYALARDYFERAARGGHVAAQAQLGTLYLEGLGVEQSNETALRMFRKAADKGNAVALNGLAVMYLTGRGVDVDAKEALRLFQVAADGPQGLPEAQFNLANMYFDGRAVARRDYKRAIHYYTLAGQQGHTLSLKQLGDMHHKGIGMHKNCNLAVSLYKNVAERGRYSRTLELAHTAFKAANYASAFVRYAEASELGFEVAQANAAYILTEYGSAVEWLFATEKERAEDDNEQAAPAPSIAQQSATTTTETETTAETTTETETSEAPIAGGPAEEAHPSESESPQLLPRNEKEDTSLSPPPTTAAPTYASVALFYYKRAAMQGNAAARVKIGDYYYYYGADYTTAASHYRTASDQLQNAQAMWNLGYMHEHGLGLPRDLFLAKRYYDMSARTSQEAYLPASLALLSVYAKFAWQSFEQGRLATDIMALLAPPPTKGTSAEAAAGGAESDAQTSPYAAQTEFLLELFLQHEDVILTVLTALFVFLLLIRMGRVQLRQRQP